MTQKITIDQVDALLPQTQCGECDYAGCRPYAQAIVKKGEAIHKCPPGGEETFLALAKLCGRDPALHLHEVREKTRKPALAFIREDACIGCTKCIKACPIDAILGNTKHMHTIISNECTGCGLCVAPCPVDCIDMLPLEQPLYDKNTAKKRYNFRQFRLQREETERKEKHEAARNLRISNNKAKAIEARKAYIQDAIARVKAGRKSK